MSLPFPLDRATPFGPICTDLNAPNLVVLRGAGTPGSFDGWLYLCYRTETGSDATCWASLAFRCATRPSWDVLVASRDEAPLLAPGHHRAAWSLVSDRHVSVLRCHAPVRVLLGHEGPRRPTISTRIHIFELADEEEMDGSIILERGAMPRLAQAIRRLHGLRGGEQPLSLTLVEIP